MRWILSLYFILLAGIAVWADEGPVNCIFYSYPERADVYVHMADNPIPGVHDQGAAGVSEQKLGKCGTPVALDFHHQRRVTVTLKLDDHQNADIILSQDMIKEGRYPQVVELKPKSILVGAVDFLQGYWKQLAVGGLLAGLGVGLGLRQKRALREVQNLQERRTQLIIGDAQDPFMGKKVGHYLVVDRLGAGGMGVVYRGVPEGTLDTRQSVAIKVILPQSAGDPEFRERFLREVKAYMELSQPNVVRLIEWGDGDPIFQVMELVDGPTLREVAGGRALPVEEMLSLFYPLLGALDYAHQRGIVHRDLKPENVMLTSKKLLKVMDFGLARRQEVSRQLTQSGTSLGTPAYMAPEQIQGVTAPSADQYSLGMMAYEMLGGRLPFEGDTMAVLFHHLSTPAPPLGQFRPDVPPALEALVMRMVEIEPGRRYPSLSAVLAELEGLYPHLAEKREVWSDPFPAGTFDNLGE